MVYGQCLIIIIIRERESERERDTDKQTERQRSRDREIALVARACARVCVYARNTQFCVDDLVKRGVHAHPCRRDTALDKYPLVLCLHKIHTRGVYLQFDAAQIRSAVDGNAFPLQINEHRQRVGESGRLHHCLWLAVMSDGAVDN